VRVRWHRPPLRPTPRAATSVPRELHVRTGTLAALSRCHMVALAREPRLAPLRHQRSDNTRSATSTPRHLWLPHFSLQRVRAPLCCARCKPPPSPPPLLPILPSCERLYEPLDAYCPPGCRSSKIFISIVHHRPPLLHRSAARVDGLPQCVPSPLSWLCSTSLVRRSSCHRAPSTSPTEVRPRRHHSAAKPSPR
jgi:hypothetical protein